MKELEDTHKAMTMLKEMAPRFHFAGRFWDMLYGLAIVGELPLPSHLMPQDSQQQNRATSTASAEESSSLADEVSANATFISLPPKLQDSTTMTSTATMQPSLEPNRSNKMGWLPHRVLYDADSSAPDYDMSLSVFSPLSTVPATSPRPAAPANPPPNPIFSGLRSHRSTSLPHLNAPIPALPQNTSVAPPAFAAPSRAQSLQTPSFDVDPTSSTSFSLPVDPPQPFQGDQSNTLAMWSNAPTGFEWDDWSAYINGLPENSATGTVFSQITQDNTHPDTTMGKVFTFYDSPL
ncbi:hypothetical protein EIP86_003391 [Pleurotus ostreatoroseus]|nr:hypothetical protein EIP86_003391 [Pleurotus ostreatoroseus]